MTGPILSYYLALLLKTGQISVAAPAPTKIVAQPKAKTTTTIVVEQDREPAAPPPVLTVDDGATKAQPVRVASDSAAEYVAQVQAFYANIKQVTAKFRQTVTNPTFGRTTTSNGMVWIKTPGKMRWDYYGKKKDKKVPVVKSFISNGTYLYVVDHSNKQVIEKSLEQNMLPVAITFLYGKGKLADDFNAELDTSGKYGAKGDVVLKLTPKVQSTQYKNLFLVVDKSAGNVKESVIVDSAGAVNHFRFLDPNFEKAVQDKSFVFNKKSVPNYRITTDAPANDDGKTD